MHPRAEAQASLQTYQVGRSEFGAYVMAFRLIRNKILDDPDVRDQEKRQARYDAEDMEAGAKTTADAESAPSTEVGKALSSWVSLEEILVVVASLILSNSISFGLSRKTPIQSSNRSPPSAGNGISRCRDGAANAAFLRAETECRDANECGKAAIPAQ